MKATCGRLVHRNQVDEGEGDQRRRDQACQQTAEHQAVVAQRRDDLPHGKVQAQAEHRRDQEGDDGQGRQLGHEFIHRLPASCNQGM